MKDDLDSQPPDSLSEHKRRLTVFDLLWAIFSLVGGLKVGAWLADVFASYGLRLLGTAGRVLGFVLGLLTGLAAIGFLSWLLIGLVIMLLIRITHYQDGSDRP